MALPPSQSPQDLLFGFRLNFLWFFVHFSLWVKLLWFLLNIL
jgi:hypothetical protein